MSSRAPIFAAVTLLISGLGPATCVQAQNLEAGKSPSELFAGACSACHKSPRGLLKTVAPGSLSAFLREHYTTSGDMASQLATYLISNGASDSKQARQGVDKRGQGGNDQSDRQGRKKGNAPGQELARPDDAPAAAEEGRQGRKRQARPAEQPEEGKPVGDAPRAAIEPVPDGKKLSAKQRKKPGRPPASAEPSMANEPASTEPAATGLDKTEPAKLDSGTDDAKVEPSQEMGNAAEKPNGDIQARDEAKGASTKSETAKTDTPEDSTSGVQPTMHRDSVPTVTALPPAASSTTPPASAPVVASGGGGEPAASRAPVPVVAEPQAVTASEPPPLRPAGLPAPPISQ